MSNSLFYFNIEKFMRLIILLIIMVQSSLAVYSSPPKGLITEADQEQITIFSAVCRKEYLAIFPVDLKFSKDIKVSLGINKGDATLHHSQWIQEKITELEDEIINIDASIGSKNNARVWLSYPKDKNSSDVKVQIEAIDNAARLIKKIRNEKSKEAKSTILKEWRAQAKRKKNIQKLIKLLQDFYNAQTKEFSVCLENQMRYISTKIDQFSPKLQKLYKQNPNAIADFLKTILQKPMQHIL